MGPFICQKIKDDMLKAPKKVKVGWTGMNVLFMWTKTAFTLFKSPLGPGKQADKATTGDSRACWSSTYSGDPEHCPHLVGNRARV